MLKVQSLREMTRAELLQKQSDLLDELFNLNMRRSLKALDNPLRLRTLNREMAKIKTVLREDELGIHKLADEKVSVLSSTRKKETSEPDAGSGE
jgi:large subunit ribosomal protein L29